MKILINTSTLSGTGVTQVSVSFILECKKYINNEYFVLTSESIKCQLEGIQFPENFTFFHIRNHPLYGLKGVRVRRQIREIEKQIKPQAVISVFGPSWYKFKAPHVLGYAYPHYVYPESPFFKITGSVAKLKISIMKTIHKYYLKRDGDYYICETEDVSNRLAKFFRISKKNIFTVSNTHNEYFDREIFNKERLLPVKSENEYRMLALSSFIAHKNLLVIKKIIPLLEKQYPEYKIKFIVTVDKKMYNKYFAECNQNYIQNLGRVDIKDCPKLYKECDFMFLPTLLECFSASYPEAMKMEKPIITSNLSFATSICGDAAEYFDPLNPEDIMCSIIKLIQQPDYQKQLIANGKKQLEKFDTAEGRAKKYLEICMSISK